MALQSGLPRDANETIMTEQGDQVSSGLSSSGVLERLSASPSPSCSSLSSSSSFDPHAMPPPRPESEDGLAGPSTRTLGLRELASMIRADRKGKKAARNAQTVPTTPMSASIVEGATGQRRSGRQATHRGAQGPTLDIPRISALSIDDASGPWSAPVSGRNSLDVPRPPIELRRSTEETRGTYAKEVVVKGWKVVGGTKWSDLGRVGAYVVYDVEISVRTGGMVNVLRRYSDFVRLRSALKHRYPHLKQAIPSLPGKAHMAKFSPKFLQDRQVRLQRFLRTVMLQPEMGKGGARSVIGAWILGDAPAHYD